MRDQERRGTLAPNEATPAYPGPSAGPLAKTIDGATYESAGSGATLGSGARASAADKKPQQQTQYQQQQQQQGQPVFNLSPPQPR
jgi:hypothetical protein